MEKSCEMLENCGFFRKYGELNILACNGLIKMYCRGDRQYECVRRQYRMEHGVPPPDDMLPNGTITKMMPLEA